MSNRFGILLYRWHSWVGLFSGVFLIFICVTGSIAVFRPEIERAVDLGEFDFEVSTPAPGQQPITIEQAIATAQAEYPGSQATSAKFPARGSSTHSHGDFYSISLRRPKERGLQVLVDPFSTKVAHAISNSGNWGDFVRQLHVRFLYGSFWGRYIVGFFGITLLFSTLSGLFIFTRFNAKSWKPKIRRGKGGRILTADLHKVVGLGSVGFNIIFGLSGAVLGLEGIYHKYIKEKSAPQRQVAVEQIAAGDIDRCVEQARALIPSGAPVGVGMNYQRSGVIKVDVVHWDTYLIRELSSYVVFKADTLQPIEIYDASKSSVGARLYYSMEPLHFGRLGGAMWVKLLWGLMGLTGGFLSVTGFMIYILRKRAAYRAKRKARRAAASEINLPEPVAVAITLLLSLAFVSRAAAQTAPATVVRSAQSGDWSNPATWSNGEVPKTGESVHIRPGHRVTYDVESDAVIRVLHVGGKLSFSRDRDTRLDVGLLHVQPGEAFAGETGIDCHAARAAQETSQPMPVLEIGTSDAPIPPDVSAVIRLTAVDGLDTEFSPGLITCGGRIELHGAPMNRTWIKLGLQAETGDDCVFLDQPVEGWRVGDRIIVTATSRQLIYTGTFTEKVTDARRTEKRIITRIDRQHDRMRLTFDEPLKYQHRVDRHYRGEVANLSRNVVIESADPAGVRGHTMFQGNSAASISYAEFRHLGKKGILGRYPLHWHGVGDAMRGSSIIGASIWDSDNHLLTIHGTQYLVVRDCVGYRSLGHGVYLEDGTESFNIIDRNLIVQAMRSEPLPGQFLPFDRNDGAGFWWANSQNAFTRNVAVECDQYGFRFEAVRTLDFDPKLSVPQPDGSTRSTDLRTIPFLRFEGNEAHAQRRFGLNLGGIPSHRGYGNDDPSYQIQTDDVDGVGPDRMHPFVLTDTLLWDCQWPFHAGSPMAVIETMDIFDSEYGIWRSVMLNHEYHDLTFEKIRSHTIFFPRTGGPNQFEVAEEPPFTLTDDQPPISVITSIEPTPAGQLRVCGSAADNGEIASVTVNGVEARPTAPGFLTWDVIVHTPAENLLESTATDATGNAEPRPHELRSISPAELAASAGR